MITIKKSRNGQFFFVVKAKNGQVLATSETYQRKFSACKAVKSLQKVMKGIKIKDETKK